MRSSTPTPSTDGSTILAGHQDIGLNEDYLEDTKWYDETGSLFQDETLQSSTEDVSRPATPQKIIQKEENVVETPQKIIQKEENMVENDLEPQSKIMYCNDWVQNESGVSTNNTDIAPSIYAPSISLSDSLLDVTSISRSVPSPVENVQKKAKHGLSSTKVDAYANTVFM